jgi:hypothetical protein
MAPAKARSRVVRVHVEERCGECRSDEQLMIRTGSPCSGPSGPPRARRSSAASAASPTTAGTPSLVDSRPRRNALVVDRLLAAGAIPLGKTNLHELAGGITSNNADFGAVDLRTSTGRASSPASSTAAKTPCPRA